ncbi:FAD-binding domain-containing protein [Pleomassaria siparia CBS 279.74]|uniref:FAD-binding domain-containing protein n=1 Tax=Pleomassaria siparia CBS 279.74 TaxID=1314801 RepID=A0A6G1KPA5_9PLEO|nr:FAD-binding domain-containing protein [Pleomassaria siparia CBS 279.74]
MVFPLRIWFSLVINSCYLSLGNAAAPDQDEILSQLKQSGTCCAALDYFLPGKVHFNILTDLGYQASQATYWSAQAQSLQPNCIVVPTSTEDVSIAVTVLNLGFQTNVQGCQFAVRSAGHTPNAGTANIDGGVTIDLQSLNQVTVSQDQKIVSIGPGNRWGNVYSKLDPLDLAMVGGRVTPVGVGGLVTGGGLSFYSGHYGFACDNIQTFEVVLANGSITTASSTTNPSLFRALKGGNNNFAIVTRFDAKLHTQAAFWGGQLFMPVTNKDYVFEYLSNLTVSSTFDPNVALISIFAWVQGVSLITQFAVYTNGTAAWPPAAYKALNAMPKLSSTIRKDKISSFALELEAEVALTTARANLFATLTFINKPDDSVSRDFMASLFDLSDAVAADLSAVVVGLIFSFSLQPLPYSLYSKSASSTGGGGGGGGNVLGLDRFSDDLISVLYTVTWILPTDGARVEAAMQQLEQTLVLRAKEMGVFSEFVYLNYAAKWQDPIKGYGAANVEFMKSVSKQYDPDGIFQHAVPGGFKLGL